MLALGLGFVNSFDMPIRQAFVVEMVGREDVANAVALNSAVFNMSRIVGPAIGGLAIAAIGLAPLFFVNAHQLPRRGRQSVHDAASGAPRSRSQRVVVERNVRDRC